MNAALPPTLALSMLSMAPQGSVVHQIIKADQAARIDAAMHADKQRDGYAHRQFANAVRLEQGLPESLRGVL
ncbi:hypothetical protein [uncultured Rhodoferax sp.]|uniref:hypothetical protein n=1 Tax=uncultured Rhodoferax sp. TaxID=223188 RepID=UPI0025F8B3D8|nr:hypothetical protein [uncultured Rhodoferax sp.]